MNEADAIRAQALAGDANAQYRLGRFMILGKIPAGSPEEPLHWIDAACRQKFPLAILFKSSLAILGVARPQSFDDAFGFLVEAAACGYERAQGQLAALEGERGFDPAFWLNPPPLEQHFGSPRIFTMSRFLPRSACDWLISQSRSRLQPAPIKHSGTGQSAVISARSNTGCGFSSIEADLVLQLTNLRIAAALGLPIAHQEPTNILHYAPGQEYLPHYDFVAHDEEQAFADELEKFGQRLATCLIYLNDDFGGGETVFPRLNWAYRGKAGDALIFWNISEQGERERNSFHAGRKVTAGEKWLYSKWVRAKPLPLQ